MPQIRRKKVGFQLALALSLAGLASQIGCDSNVDEKIAVAKLAESCLVNSDCSTPLVCAFEACHAECETSRDCDPGARCVAAARPFKVCQLEEERVCARTADCAEGLICGIDGECRDQCVADSDCVEGQSCASGTCADVEELDESGELPVAKGMDRGSEGSPCVYVSDCSGVLLCRDRACLAECKADRDCALGKVCDGTRCVDDENLPIACTYSSDCETERGQRCLGGNCLCMCAENRDCPKGQACNGCGCETDPNAPQSCVYNSDCETPGEICQNRECACECQQNSDCGEGQACDGCGCFDPKYPVDGIVRGTVTIESSLQLPLYEGVTEILGDLYINNSAITDLGPVFDELQHVKGRILIGANNQLAKISFPKLKKTPWFSLSNMSALTSIDLPVFESGSLDIGSLDKVTSLNIDSLQTGIIQLYALPKLKRLDAPALTELTTLSLTDLAALEEIHLPELERVSGTLNLQEQSQASLLRVLSAPKLSTVDVLYLLINRTKLETLDDFGRTPWTINSTDLQITDNPVLSNCEIAEFVTRFKAGGFTGSVTATGNLSCPACEGPNCPTN